MKPPVKMILKIFGIIMAIILVVAVIYVAYVFFSYHRIEDNQSLKIIAPAMQREVGNEKFSDEGKVKISESVKTDIEYTIGTYNVGFGAYLPDYSFFMDGGKESRCYSKKSAAQYAVW